MTLERKIVWVDTETGREFESKEEAAEARIAKELEDKLTPHFTPAEAADFAGFLVEHVDKMLAVLGRIKDAKDRRARLPSARQN